MASHSSQNIPDVLAERYEVEVEIGSGAFATTWRGRDRRLDRQVAIKILSDAFAKDPAYVQRFEREAQTAAAISNANVVDVYDFGQQGPILYIVMQYIAGEDLKHLIERERVLSPERARAITLNVLNGLGAIHNAGIIHRDIKPQNILIGADGSAMVADFGIAQQDADSGLTSTGTTIGTVAYMAPEQAEGVRLSPATDLYAVGVMLYEMLTGSLPFQGPTPVSIMMAHINQAPVPPSQRSNGRPVPPDLEGIVLQAMAKDPRDRFRSASAMAKALQSASLSTTAQRTVATPRSAATTSGTRTTAAPTRPSTRQASIPRSQPSASLTDASRIAAAEREGSGLRSVVGTLLLFVLVVLIALTAYVWWNGREDDANGVAPTATSAVVAPTDAPTDEPLPTDPSVDDDVQLIEPSDGGGVEEVPTEIPTEEPTAEPTLEPTAIPTDIPTEIPPTEPPLPTDEPDQIIEPIESGSPET